MPQRAQAESAEGAWAMPPRAVSRRLAGRAWPTLSMTFAISSKGTRRAARGARLGGPASDLGLATAFGSCYAG